MTIRRMLWWIVWAACECMAVRSAAETGWVLLWGLAGFSVAALLLTSHDAVGGWWAKLAVLGGLPVALVILMG